MSEIKGIEGLSDRQINRELEQGARFVAFSYCFSIIIMTFRNPTESVYFVKAGESAIKYSWKYSLLTFLVGWWGIPFGPIYTIGALIRNFKGGYDVTMDVIEDSNHR